MDTFKDQRIQGIVTLLLIALVWGTTFPLLKLSLAELSPGMLIFGRFFCAAVILIPFAFPLDRALIKDGVLLGAVFFSPWPRKILG
jgi:drug/metabolite transporter (DMT)-like permease